MRQCDNLLSYNYSGNLACFVSSKPKKTPLPMYNFLLNNVIESLMSRQNDFMVSWFDCCMTFLFLEQTIILICLIQRTTFVKNRIRTCL